MSGHTPGPWFAGETNDVFAECQEDGDDPIASIHDRDNTTEAILESAANAKLIAEAPAMLEVLIEVSDFWAGGDCPKELWDKIQAVLARHQGSRP